MVGAFNEYFRTSVFNFYSARGLSRTKCYNELFSFEQREAFADGITRRPNILVARMLGILVPKV